MPAIVRLEFVLASSPTPSWLDPTTGERAARAGVWEMVPYEDMDGGRRADEREMSSPSAS